MTNLDEGKSRLAGLSAIVAMTPEGVIGLDGDMPWRLSSDLRRFKRLTMGGTLIMGRKTFDSIGKLLPGRQTIVISRNEAWEKEGVWRASTPESAVELARTPSNPHSRGIFVVGGAEIYRLMLPLCERILLTRVWSSVKGDTILKLDLSEYEMTCHQRLPASTRDQVPTEFIEYKSSK